MLVNGKQIKLGSIPGNKLETDLLKRINNVVLDNDSIPANGAIQQYNSATQRWEYLVLEDGFSYFPIWAEESGGCINSSANGGFQFSYGNGDETSQNTGINLFTDCELVSIGLSSEDAVRGSNIGVVRNSIPVTSTGLQPDGLNWLYELPTPVTFSSGDIVNMYTIDGSGGSAGVRIVRWFKYVIPNGFLQGVKGENGTNFNDQLFGNGAPSNLLSENGDIYFDNDNGDIYRKGGLSWTFQQTFTSNATSIKMIEVTNNISEQSNINDSTSGTQFDTINTTPLIDTSTNLYTVSSDGVVVNGGWCL